MDTLLTIVFAMLSVALWTISTRFKKRLEKEYSAFPTFLPPDGDEPSSLIRVNGCGTSMSGSFRSFQIDGVTTTVSYRFLYVLFLPLIPLKCYRVVKEGGTYRFLGSDTMNWKELLCVYMDSFKWVFSVLTVIMLITMEK